MTYHESIPPKLTAAERARFNKPPLRKPLLAPEQTFFQRHKHAMIALLVFLVVLMVVWMTGCSGQSIFKPWTWLSSPKPSGGNGGMGNPDTRTLNWFAALSFIPGVGCLILSIVIPQLGALRRLSFGLIGLGLAVAIAAMLAKAYATWIVLAFLGASAVWFSFIMWQKFIDGRDYRARRAELLDLIRHEEDETKRERHYGALAALERIYSPAKEELFRLNKINAHSLVKIGGGG